MSNILQDIFIDHYEQIQYTLRPRPVEMENISKMINCGDHRFGGAMYGCTHCGNLKFIPFRCHSRFCPTCGNLYSRVRAEVMAGKLVNCNHRHCVFTIPEELRLYFKKDRSLLDCLFNSTKSVIMRLFLKDNKANFTPGFILVMHTFGRPLEWNPHIHCLVSEGGFSDNAFWRHKKHFNYKFLRFAFRTALLNDLEKRIGPSFKKIKALMYKRHKDGFYVYAKPNLTDAKLVTEYIGRYLGRPVIATSRIDNYDRFSDTVTFHYNRHEDDALVVETIPAIDFINLLIQHIPEKNFKMIRYYGLYARHRSIDKKLFKLRSKRQQKYLMSFHKWKFSILTSFGYDPLQCSCCNNQMVLLDLYHNHERVSLENLYKKAKLKHKASIWRSTS